MCMTVEGEDVYAQLKAKIYAWYMGKDVCVGTL